MSQDLRANAESLLRGLPSEGNHWYVEAVRPGHEDEARVYGSGHWGIAKPTPNTPAYRRPIAAFIAAAPQLVRDLLTALEAAERRERIAFEAGFTAGWYKGAHDRVCNFKVLPLVKDADEAYTAYQAHAQTSEE